MKRYLLLLGFMLGSFVGWMPLRAQNPVLFIGEAVAGGTTGNVLYINGSVLGHKAATTLAFPGTLSIASGKTLIASNTLTLAGTDSTTMTFPTTSATVARTDAGNTFTGVSTGTSWNLTTPTITTSMVFGNGQGFYDVAADTIGIYRSTNAQKLQLYETRTDASNYSRLSISAPSGGPITFASEAAGTGTARAMSLNSPTYIDFNTNGGIIRQSLNGFYPVTTNSLDLGYALGGFSWRTITLTNLIQFDNAGTPDAFIKRAAAASIQLGVDVNGAAVSQTIQAANAITGTNLAGGNLTLRPGAGTGTGTISALIFQSPTLGSTGTTAQTQTTRFTLDQTSGRFVPPVTMPYVQMSTLYSAAGTALPTCNGGLAGAMAAVSDATLPTFLTAYTSGGAVTSPVFCDGTSWKTY